MSEYFCCLVRSKSFCFMDFGRETFSRGQSNKIITLTHATSSLHWLFDCFWCRFHSSEVNILQWNKNDAKSSQRTNGDYATLYVWCFFVLYMVLYTELVVHCVFSVELICISLQHCNTTLKLLKVLYVRGFLFYVR